MIVVDTSPYPDAETADQQDVVLRNRDANAPFNAVATQRLADACERLGIRYSFKDEYIEEKNRQAAAAGQPTQSLGSTELGRITAASAGLVEGTTLQIPTTGYHTTEESASVPACQSFLRLLMSIANLS